MGENLRICRACLSTKVKLYDIYQYNLDGCLEELTGILIYSADGLPPFLCNVCISLIKKHENLKNRCLIANKILKEMKLANNLTEESIKKLKQINTVDLILTNIIVNSYKTNQQLSDNLTEPPKLQPNVIPPQCIDITESDEEGASFFEQGTSDPDEKNSTTNNINMMHNLDKVVENLVDEDFIFVNESEGNEDNVKVKQVRKVDDQNECILDGSDDEYILDGLDDEYILYGLDEVGVEGLNGIDAMDEDEIEGFNGMEGEEITAKDAVDKQDMQQAKAVKSMLTKKPQIKSVKARRERKKMPRKKNGGLPLDFPKSYYDTEKELTEEEIKMRSDIMEKFTKTYNVEVKILTKEEQIATVRNRQMFGKYQPFVCKLCCRGYVSSGAYDTHMTTRHDPAVGDYECDICFVRSKTLAAKMRHISQTHQKRFICKLCGVVTKAASFARAHAAQHNSKKYECTQCDKSFVAQSAFLRHQLRSHAVRAAAACPLCGQDYRGRRGLAIHFNRAHKEYVQCDGCKCYFANKSVVRRHLKQRKDEVCSPDVSPCPGCALNFPSERKMRSHYVKTHRKYRRNGNKLQPLEAENTPDAFAVMCEVCGKKLKSSSQLVTHQRVHTGEKPHECKICGKRFRIFTHMRIHSGERGYKCPICPKTFRQLGHREVHMVTHTNERPYSCDVCQKSYTGMCSLTEHNNVVHKGLPGRRRAR